MQPLGFPSPECGAISQFCALNSVLDPLKALRGSAQLLSFFTLIGQLHCRSANTRLAGQAISLYLVTFLMLLRLLKYYGQFFKVAFSSKVGLSHLRLSLLKVEVLYNSILT